MEWVFIYLPPLLAVWLAVLGGALLAWMIPIGNLIFWQRWMLASLLVIAIPALGYVLTFWWKRKSEDGESNR